MSLMPELHSEPHPFAVHSSHADVELEVQPGV